MFKDVFTNETGFSAYDDTMNTTKKVGNVTLQDYMKFEKGIESHIEKMTCRKYFDILDRKVFSKDPMSGVDKNKVWDYADAMLFNNEKFPLPFINLHPYYGPGQEGRHRMLALENAYGQFATGNVLVLTYPDDVTKEDIVDYCKRRWGDSHYESFIDYVENRLKYYSQS